MRYAIAAVVTLAVATATHLDWHVARPAIHHLSLGWRWHWLLAVPVFALTAWYVHRAWPERRLAASVAIIGIGFAVGGIIEPAWEYFVDSSGFEWAFGAARNTGAMQFLGAGLLSYILTLAVASAVARHSAADRRPKVGR